MGKKTTSPPSLQLAPRSSPPAPRSSPLLLLPASRAGLEAALPELPGSPQHEPRAHTPGTVDWGALWGVGAPRPLQVPLSVCWRGAGRGLCGHSHALPPSRLSLSRWSVLLPFAAARSFAASVLSLSLRDTANVDGELPSLSDIFADSPSQPALARRVA